MSNNEKVQQPKRIQKLDENVVNRIAAGEIIIAPHNALKEMLENSIDAGSTSIEINVKDGGVKLLQITDNGSGINKSDLPIVCNRHTTSKLQTFDDLATIQTYGFRGEALASISYIAHLTITTKIDGEATAWRAKYLNGEIAPSNSEPRPVAGKNGTQISVEDLFFNMPSRLRSLKNKNEEFVKILDVAGKYAIKSQGIGISCKRSGDNHASLSIQKDMSVIDRIRSVYNADIANELLRVDIAEENDYGFQGATGQITNANFSSKKSIPPIFFINNRLVSNEPLRRSLIQIYNTYLPKGRYPFIYLDIEIDPRNVDVNVHPTKREVRFLYEDEIIEKISSSIEESLQNVDSSRSYQTQTVLTGLSQQTFATDEGAGSKISQRPTAKPYEHKMVRTDARQQSITSLFSQQPKHQSQPEPSSSESNIAGEHNDDDVQQQQSFEFKPVKLNSIKSLRQNVENNAHDQLTKLFSNHTFVGIVDYNRRLAAIQHDVKLFLIDYAATSTELFYQIGLSDFANFGTISFEDEDGLSIQELLEIAVEEINPADPSKTIEKTLNDLQESSEMLQEYFSIDIENNSLKTIPLLLKGYTPSMNKLPGFVYRLGTQINWNDETECLDGILREIALLYAPDSLPEEDSDEYIDEQEQIQTTMKDIIFPAFQKRLIASKSLLDGVVEIANLPGLYRVFERC